MKEYIILSIVCIVLLVMVYTNTQNNMEHKEFVDETKAFKKEIGVFKKEMEAFKNKGGRNTAKNGLDLCDRINILEFHLKDEVPLTDCSGVYQ